MCENSSQIDKFKDYFFIDLKKKKTINLVDLINDNYTNSKNDFFYVLFFFSATWLPDSSSLLADKIQSFYQIKKKNFDNLELIFFSSDKSFSEYKSFMEKNSFIRYTLDFFDHQTKSQLIKFFNIQSLPFVGIIRFDLDKDLAITGMCSEKKDVKNFLLHNEPGFPWFIEQKNQIFKAETRLLDEILANMSLIKSRATHKDNYESIKANNMFLFVLFMSNQVMARKQIIKSFIKFDKNFSKSFKLVFLYIDLDKYDCKELHNTSWYTIGKTYFKWKIMRHYSVEFLPKLLVLDLKTGDLLNAKIMSRMTELYHNFIKNGLKNNYLSNDDLRKRKFVCAEILSQLKKNLIDVCVNEKKEDGTKVLFLLYFCSYNTAIGTMNTYNEITNFLSQMPQLKRYLVKIVLISSDPSKESFLKLIEELKLNKSSCLSLSALSFESNKIKESLLRDLQIIGIPWFVIIDSRKGLVLCENVKFFFQQNNSENKNTLICQ